MIIRPATNTLIINSYGLIILTKETLVSLEIRELIAAPFVILVKKARKRQKPFTVFKALLEDIIKVLRFKTTRTPAKIRKLVLAQYHDYLPLFEEDIDRNYHRTNLVLITH